MARIAILVLLFITTLFQSCSTGDDVDAVNSSSYMVGTWEGIEYYDSGEVYPDEPGAVTWIFTSNRLTVQDEEDVMNGQTVVYEYILESQELILMGWVFDVEIINGNEMIIHHDSAGYESGQKFRRKN